MTAPLTDEQLAAIEARLAAATPGPWIVLRLCNGIIANGPQGETIHVPHHEADADLIAHAPADIAALLQALRAERAEVAHWKETSESWRASAGKWQQWAGDLLDELGRQPIGGQHGDEPARELIAQLAGMAPGVPRCERCGCFSTRHEVDDEELRACVDCECVQFLVQP